MRAAEPCSIRTRVWGHLARHRGEVTPLDAILSMLTCGVMIVLISLLLIGV